METYYPQMERESCGRSRHCNVNVGEAERMVSALVGGVLALGGLRRIASMRGLAMLAVGGGLIYRGVSGHCSMYQQLGINSNQPAEVQPSRTHLEPQSRDDFDPVDEASYESFPASDPPAYSSMSASGPRYPR